MASEKEIIDRDVERDLVQQQHQKKPQRYEDSASADEKAASDRAEDAASVARATGLQPPDFIRAWTAEERAEKEKALKRKIDVRLLPAIIIMYILNYIDR